MRRTSMRGSEILSLAPRGVLRKALGVTRAASRGEDMTFRSIWPVSGSLRRLLFQKSLVKREEVWRNVLLFQQAPIINWKGRMYAVFSGSAGPGVTAHA